MGIEPLFYKFLAQTNWEAAIAILDGALQKEGRKKDLATYIGATQSWVSMFRNSSGDRWYRPSQEQFDKILTLPIEPELRVQLKEYYERSTEETVQTWIRPRRSILPEEARGLLTEMQEAIHKANTENDPSRRSYLRAEAHRKGILKLIQLNPLANIYLASNFAEACLFLSHLNLQLNRPEWCYWYARLAERALVYRRERNISTDRRSESIELEALHTQVNALHHLGAYREADDIHKQVARKLHQTNGIWNYHRSLWLPRFNRDRIATAQHIPRRYLLHELEKFAEETYPIIEQAGGEQSLKILVDRALMSVYIRQRNEKNYRKARRLIGEHWDYVETARNLDPLIATMFYRTCAQLEWLKGQWKNPMWEYVTSKALQIAYARGFEGQLAGISRNFPGAVDTNFPRIL